MGKTEKGKHSGAAEATVAEKCVGEGCKSNAKRFGFCEEHFEHFKFGLIKKTGQPVPDYEKKFGQYMAWKQASTVRKAA